MPGPDFSSAVVRCQRRILEVRKSYVAGNRNAEVRLACSVRLDNYPCLLCSANHSGNFGTGRKDKEFGMSEDVIVGVILAGGQGRRMGGREKFALTLGGERLVDIAARRLEPQVKTIVVASSREVGGGLASCADIFEGSMGPLAGLHAAFAWAVETSPDFRAVVSIPVDCPFFPEDLVAQLDAAGPPAFAGDPERPHPIFGLWPRGIVGRLTARLESGVDLAIEVFAAEVGARRVDFPDSKAFFNINREADLEEAERLIDLTV